MIVKKKANREKKLYCIVLLNITVEIMHVVCSLRSCLVKLINSDKSIYIHLAAHDRVVVSIYLNGTKLDGHLIALFVNRHYSILQLDIRCLTYIILGRG